MQFRKYCDAAKSLHSFKCTCLQEAIPIFNTLFCHAHSNDKDERRDQTRSREGRKGSQWECSREQEIDVCHTTELLKKCLWEEGQQVVFGCRNPIGSIGHRMLIWPVDIHYSWEAFASHVRRSFVMMSHARKCVEIAPFYLPPPWFCHVILHKKWLCACARLPETWILGC